MGVRPFCHVSRKRMRGDDLKLQQGRFRLDTVKKIIITERLIRHWNKFPGVLESLSLEVFRTFLDVALGIGLEVIMVVLV